MRTTALVIMVLLAAPWKAGATEVNHLYEAQVSVSSRTEEARRIAARAALRQVFLKVVGNRSTLAQASLAPILHKAVQLIQKFRYYTPEKENSQTMLWVRFNPHAVKQALRQQGLPVWGRRRPALLLWVAIENGMNRYLLDASTTLPAARILREQAKARGIPIMFPLWDLEDRSRLSLTDIWGNFSGPLLAASARYPAAVQLVGRVWHRQADDWRARWTLYSFGKTRSWSAEGTMGQVLRAGINKAVDAIAARVVPLNGDTASTAVRIAVANVTSFGDYARLFTYLSSLSQVTDIQPVRLSPTQARFRMELLGDLKGLRASLRLGRVLARTEQAKSAPSNAAGAKLHYRLLP